MAGSMLAKTVPLPQDREVYLGSHIQEASASVLGARRAGVGGGLALPKGRRAVGGRRAKPEMRCAGLSSPASAQATRECRGAGGWGPRKRFPTPYRPDDMGSGLQVPGHPRLSPGRPRRRRSVTSGSSPGQRHWSCLGTSSLLVGAVPVLPPHPDTNLRDSLFPPPTSPRSRPVLLSKAFRVGSAGLRAKENSREEAGLGAPLFPRCFRQCGLGGGGLPGPLFAAFPERVAGRKSATSKPGTAGVREQPLTHLSALTEVWGPGRGTTSVGEPAFPKRIFVLNFSLSHGKRFLIVILAGGKGFSVKLWSPPVGSVGVC